jgi:hypothetical protein
MTGSLLSPRLPSAAGNLSACLGFLCALTKSSQMLYNSKMYQVLLDVCSKYGIRYIHLTDFLAIHIVN